MQKWEYLTLNVYWMKPDSGGPKDWCSSSKGRFVPVEMSDELDHRGAEGWELVNFTTSESGEISPAAITYIGTNAIRYVFKRPLY